MRTRHAALLSTLLALSGHAAAQQPLRLADLTGDGHWLQLSGRQRTRFESLNGQVRAGATRPDTEDQWFTRTSLRADLDFGGVGGTLELMDSRAFGSDNPNRAASTSFVNTTDFIEANLTVDLGATARGRHRLLVGRWTMSLGSRRFVIRNGYRNTVNNYTGVDYLWQGDDGGQLRAFWTMPVRRRPFDAPSLRDNDFEWDDQDLDLQFFGVFGVQKLDDRTDLEAYVFGLHEDAADSTNRRLMTPGVRFHRPAKRADYFWQLEGAFQFGQSQASAGMSPTLDHSAYFLHGSIGYVGDCACEPTIRIAYDYATGDRDPTDGDNNRFDRLFGAPRFEYGPTGLWGIIQRTNFNSPELRVSIRPTEHTWVMLNARDMRLASSRDQWVANGVVDPSGAAGDRVGQQYELRVQYHALPKNMFVEVGGAYLAADSFLARAPNSRGGGDSRYGFVEMRWQF